MPSLLRQRADEQQGSQRCLPPGAVDLLAQAAGRPDPQTSAARAPVATAAAAPARHDARADAGRRVHPLRQVRRGLPRRRDPSAARRLRRQGRGHAVHRRALAAVRVVHRAAVHARVPVGRAAARLRQPRRDHGHRGPRRAALRGASRPGVRRVFQGVPGARRDLDRQRPAASPSTPRPASAAACASTSARRSRPRSASSRATELH